MTHASKVEIDHVTKRFGAFVAVDDLTLNVPEGTVFGLLGPNGAGKTTTIRMILNIFRPEAGEIRIDGAPVNDSVRRAVGYLPEERGLYKKMRVGEQLEYLARLRGLDKTQARTRSKSYLERIGLADWAGRKVEDLSKGMQQKVQFCAALIHEPTLVILDEPFSGLDPINSQLLIDWMAELSRDGVTIILSAHQMETVERLCKSIALINHGRLLVSGDLREIKRRHGGSRVRLEMADGVEFTPSGREVREARQVEHHWEIELAEGADGSELLREAMRHGAVTRFERVVPTLQELFVQFVEASARGTGNGGAANHER